MDSLIGRVVRCCKRFLVVVLATLSSVEVLARADYAWHHQHLPFFSSGHDFIYRFYPELQPALQPEHGAGDLRVLLLGGSTLHPEFGDVAERLADRLQERFRQPIRMVNLAMPAQGVLDCDYKYRFLRQRRFDVVALYVGMNDLRANNVPDTLWRDDYGHYCWYDELSFFMLMTFAYHLPEDYSMDRLRNGTLDYVPSPQASPVELWGAPAHVRTGLTVHNQIIREVAQRHPSVIFIDQDQLMSHHRRWFIDMCHLSPAGSAEFVANIMAELQKRQSGIGHGAPIQKIVH